MTHERQPIQNGNENLPRVLSEIGRPHVEEVTLFDYKDALAVDDQMVLAYKHFWVPGKGDGDKILVARERTVPIKAEIFGRERIYPYPNEDELRGEYGVLIMRVDERVSSFYVGEQYRVIFDGAIVEAGNKGANITIESTEPMRLDFIDGGCDYNHFLRLANANNNRR
jgi:hypothetical protein